MRWVIRFTFPSGSKFVASHFEKRFALVPIDPTTNKFKNGAAFETEKAARDWYDKVLSLAEPQITEGFRKMKTEFIECQIDQ